jgi:hypothetical protein
LHKLQRVVNACIKLTEWLGKAADVSDSEWQKKWLPVDKRITLRLAMLTRITTLYHRAVYLVEMLHHSITSIL